MSNRYYIVGVNHETAPLAVREKLAFTPESLPDGLASLCSRDPQKQAVILSTCNRAEIICFGSSPEDVVTWLALQSGISANELHSHVYQLSNDAAVKHLCRVAGGLDSMILGEPQILGQLKQAFADGEQNATVSSELQRLFQHAFHCAKRIRSETEIGRQPVSVAYAAASTTRRMFADISKHKALLVGAGDTIELVTRHLIELGLNDFTIVNRNLQRAQNMANELGGNAGSLDSIDEHLHTADIVISSTAAAHTVISATSVSAAFKKRKHRPMLMIDLAVPRDIDPLVEELNDVYLYTVDHLSDIIQQGKEARFKAAESAEIIVTDEVEKFSSWQAGRSVVDTIKALRETTDTLSNEVTQRALNRLAAGHDSSEVVVELARSLSQKLLHNPTTAIREAAESNNQGLLDAAHTLFDISNPSKSDHQEKPE